ncbi:hypothetical protein ACFY3M_50900 [Streptomyces mirabilis]|uniref:hypothetical protein n=1 Tax=Streptomyces mirabilis TaxID=68239 RepID=UPI00367A6E88
MELVHPLDGLDSRPWSSCSHAYGSAEDLPDLLRALADCDAGATGEALSELYGSVLHQGTVYAASAEVAPFLARVAVAGRQVADVLMLLGGMAESEDEHGVAPGTVRAAVAGQLPLLLPLLDAAEPEVRRTAVWAVSHTKSRSAITAVIVRAQAVNAGPVSKSAARRSRWRPTALSAIVVSWSHRTAATRSASSASATASRACR